MISWLMEQRVNLEPLLKKDLLKQNVCLRKMGVEMRSICWFISGMEVLTAVIFLLQMLLSILIMENLSTIMATIPQHIMKIFRRTHLYTTPQVLVQIQMGL